MKNIVGCQIAMNARIGLECQVTATLGFHSLYDWYFQMMWLKLDAPKDSEDDTAMENHGPELVYSTVTSLMYAIRTEDHNTQQHTAHRMIQIKNYRTITRWSESKLANEKSLVRIPNKNAQLVDLQSTEDEQATLMTLVERYTLLGASGA
jgi:hypothetical protein